jgi:hypothetical protein
MKAQSNRQKFLALAATTHGVVTTKEATAIGIPAVELRKLVARDAIQRIGTGVYRSPFHPKSIETRHYAAIQLIAADAFLMGQSVLWQFDLLEQEPNQITLGTRTRVRKRYPRVIDVYYISKWRKDSFIQTNLIRHQSVFDALIDLAIRSTMNRREFQKAKTLALALGVITEAEHQLIDHEISKTDARQDRNLDMYEKLLAG